MHCLKPKRVRVSLANLLRFWWEKTLCTVGLSSELGYLQIAQRKKIHFLTFTTLIPMLMGVEMCVEYQCVLLVILETLQTCLSGARASPKGCCCLVIAMFGPNTLANTTLPIWSIFQVIFVFNLFRKFFIASFHNFTYRILLKIPSISVGRYGNMHIVLWWRLCEF